MSDQSVTVHYEAGPIVITAGDPEYSSCIRTSLEDSTARWFK